MKNSKVLALLLAAVMVLTFMPAMAFAEDAVEKDLSKYEVVETDINRDADEWRIFTDTTDNITLNVEVRCGDYVLPAENYDLHIEKESFVDDEPVFTPVENGKISLSEEGDLTVIAYAVAKDGSGFTGQTEREHYVDFCYKFNLFGCRVIFPEDNLREDIITPMTSLFSFSEGEAVGAPAITMNGVTLKAGTDYEITYAESTLDRNHVKMGKDEFDVYWINVKEGGQVYDSVPTQKGIYKCIIKSRGEYSGENTQTNIQICSANTMKVSAAAKTVKYSKVKKKAQTVAPIKVSKAKGYVTYSGEGSNAKSKKALKINAKNGKITVKKGTKKGTYKMKVTVSASGDETSNGKTVSKTVSIKVK